MSQAVDPSQLGLSNEELDILRQGQHAVAAAGSSSSRAASRASSHGLLVLDQSSLSQLGQYFSRVMSHISQQLNQLIEQSQVVTTHMYDQAGNVIDNCDAEIARYHRINQQIDELELEFDRIRHIRDIVKGFRQRAEEMERDLERSQPSSSSSRHRDGHHHHSSKHHRHGHSSSRRH